jgi:hypothetical protein
MKNRPHSIVTPIIAQDTSPNQHKAGRQGNRIKHEVAIEAMLMKCLMKS